MDVERVVPVTDKTMIEKWLLVFLIVGGTSLVFLICFPIDFYLYRRRKKLARERMSSHKKTPIQANRAGQYHARVYPDAPTSGGVSGVDDVDKVSTEDGKHDPKKQNKFVRIVNLFRKRKTEQRLMQLQMPTESKSESSSSDNRSALINAHAREDLCTNKSRGADFMSRSAEQTSVFTTKSVTKTEECYTEYQGLQDGRIALQEKLPEEGVPYMAHALSVMMRENEELFGPESKHMNYGSTEKINGVQMNRRIYETLNKSFMSERGITLTAPGGQNSFFSDTDDSARPGPVSAVALDDSGDSLSDSEDSGDNGHQRRVIKVRSNGGQHSQRKATRKGQQVKRSKMAAKDVHRLSLHDSDKNVNPNRDLGLPPASLPHGIVAFNLSDSDDDIAPEVTETVTRSDQHLDTDEIPNDGTASPVLLPIKTSFSAQYLTNGGAFGSRSSAFPPYSTIDELSDSGSQRGFPISNYSLMDEGFCSSSRPKRSKKKGGNTHSLPNLTTAKTSIHNKLDYYRNRQGAGGKDVSFSRY